MNRTSGSQKLTAKNYRVVCNITLLLHSVLLLNQDIVTFSPQTVQKKGQTLTTILILR
jgi:hypothetical protein